MLFDTPAYENLAINLTIFITVGSRFSNWAHYNEFVESGFGSWVLIRRRLVLRGEKRTGSDDPRSQGERTPCPRTRIPSSFRIPGASLLFPGPPSPRPLHLCEISVVIYLTPPSSSSYTCQSSMPILECTSRRPLFLALCELPWPLSHCPGVTSTSMGLGCQLWVFNADVAAFPGVAFLPCSYGQLVGLGIPFVIFMGIVLGDVAPSYPVILACRGQGRPWQFILAVWIPFVRPRTLLLS